MFKKLSGLRTIGVRLGQSQQLCQQFNNLTVGGRTNYATSTSNDSDSQNPFLRKPAVEKAALDFDDNERERRLKVLKLEADIANQEGRRVPELDFFQDYHWEHVLNLKSKSARVKYYSYLWQIERKREGRAQRKQERAEYGVQRKEEIKREIEENKHIVYGLSHTSLFLRIYDSAINQFQNNRLTRAMQFSPKIVLDCSYDDYMNQREATNAAKQLMLCFADNRANDDPFDLHYCNVNFQTPCIQSLHRHIPTMLNPEFPMNVHQECFTKIFPKENLVYLTPHCRTNLEAYNPDDVYIIGAMVDKINNEPLSLAKAKKLGIRMARLPLDNYLQWGSGSGKSLTLNQMVNILLDLKKTGDWQKALQHVPRRKIVDERLELQNQRKTFQRRAVQLSMGVDGLVVEHNASKRTPRDFPANSRQGNPFSSDSRPVLKSKFRKLEDSQ